MQLLKSIGKLLSPHCVLKSAPAAGVKTFEQPPSFDDVEYPDNLKLKVVPRVPIYPGNMRPFRTQKKLRLMRGPELYHNTLQHKQYGLIATSGGRMKHCHFEMIRLKVVRSIEYGRIFALWRVPEPWQPVTAKGAGARMGRGKGSINHYVTPVKANQVIFEMGGAIEYFEVKNTLENIAKRLPFDAMAVSQEIMEQRAEEKRRLREDNQNPWTWKYIIQNNMLGCHRWISKYDRRWFNEYL